MCVYVHACVRVHEFVYLVLKDIMPQSVGSLAYLYSNDSKSLHKTSLAFTDFIFPNIK